MLLSCYELGHQPLAAAWAAAVLADAGFTPRVRDLAIEEFTVASAVDAQMVVLLTPMHTALRVAVRAARTIRAAQPTTCLVFAGLYAALNRDWLFAEALADFVLAGEYEPALAALALALSRGDPPAVDGVMRPGDAFHPLRRRVVLPLPARRGLPPLSASAHLIVDGTERLAGAVESTRGCKHQCRHCPIPAVYGGHFVAVDADTVMADIAQLVAAGATHITFADPDFFNGPTHGRRILRQMHAAFPALTADVTIKVEHLVEHAALLPELRAHGVIFVVSAVESLSPLVLEHLDKGHSRADAERAAASCRAAGLAFRPTFVPFTPWTTLADYQDMLDFIVGADLIGHVDAVQYGIRLLVPPGSLLLRNADRAAAFGPLDPDAFSHRWTHPDPRMDRLAEAVAARVAHAAHVGDTPEVAFAAVCALVAEARGETAPAEAMQPALRVRQAPRLSEPWFC